ncbi:MULTISPECIES: argininosuccinate lyase [unclassified Streptomyces]|uniref:argininosuccinate lyase n=1 Tax=unclassified Streptomyces TaxID=2593676 RepID=UPI00343452F1
MSTGRIKGALSHKAQRLYYGLPDDPSDLAALRLISRVDRAHVVMLAEQRIIPPDRAARLLRTVSRVEEEGFAAVLSRPRPRGLYLAYEQALSELCGSETGGLLHTGRSRNDLNATTTLLALRRQGIDLLAGGCRLLTTLLAAAGKHLDAVMAIHTHYQPAMPITYGYYLTGVALALHRDLERIAHAVESIRRCPLGAHAVAGTDLALNTARTAALLGFESGPLHAVDAIASRDIALDTLANAANLGVTVSRLATDLQLWSTSELGYLDFPDWLVGSSSAMPQKRNAFLLEYLKARPSRVVGAWVTAVTASKSVPFTNSIEVGTEAMAPVETALRTTDDILAMAALVVSGARPRVDTAWSAAGQGFVDATVLANELVGRGVPFREAHERIGAAVLGAIENGAGWPPEGLSRPDLREVADRARYGGGPGSREASLAAARELRHELHRTLERIRTTERLAAERLHRASEELIHG